jgi:hypothetical protein
LLTDVIDLSKSLRAGSIPAVRTNGISPAGGLIPDTALRFTQPQPDALMKAV